VPISGAKIQLFADIGKKRDNFSPKSSQDGHGQNGQNEVLTRSFGSL
jgi:hypothetical protein